MVIEWVNLGEKIGLKRDKKKVKLVKLMESYYMVKTDILKRLMGNLKNKVMDKKELQVDKIKIISYPDIEKLEI